jgi:hypothetical protein
MTLGLFFLVLALVLFFLAFIGVAGGRLNLTAGGLCALTAAVMVGNVGVG